MAASCQTTPREEERLMLHHASRLRSWSVSFALALGCTSLSAKHERTPASSALAQPSAHLPDDTGWGSAAGLRYLELMLGGARRDQTLPMLVMIHGMGDQPDASWRELVAIDQPARMIVPQAPMPHGRGYSWLEYRLNAPNPPDRLARDISAATDSVSRFIASVTQLRPTAGAPVVSGFSQGGMLSFAIAIQHPEQIKLAVPIAGLLPEPLWPSAQGIDKKTRRVPIRALHGTADPWVAIDVTRGLVERLRSIGYDVELHEYPGVEHTVSADMQQKLSTLLRAAL